VNLAVIHIVQGQDHGRKGRFGRPSNDCLRHIVSNTSSQLCPRRWCANNRFNGSSLVALLAMGLEGKAIGVHALGLTIINLW